MPPLKPRVVPFLMMAALLVPLGCAPAEDGPSGGSGGASSSGGAPGSGGAVSSGGAPGSGGAVSSGGAPGSGGAVGSGGSTGSGGATSTGGSATGGSASGGRAGGGPGTTGGAGPGSGGAAGGAGRPGTGGAVGGAMGSGGRPMTGGAPGTGGAGTGGMQGGNSALCPPGITQTITVAKDGSGQFNTVQAAVNSIAANSTAHIRIDIKAGSYKEKLTIASRTNLCLVGASNTSTILTYNDASATVNSTSGSASVLISADDFSAANLTFENSYGSGSQAVALRATGKRQQYLNCRFVGYQDTLYTHNGSQYFKNCYVQGNTDYVFGGATAILDGCEVRNVEGGSAVAAPNTDIGTAYGIVFLGGKFTAASGVKANSVALGRPWGADGFGAYLKIDLGAHIISSGFVAMSNNQPQNARFHEFQSTGAGANASSRNSYQLNASQANSYTIATILGGWTPSYSQ